MSTLAYGALTAKREEAGAGTSTTTAAPGVKTYVDTMAALVPVEVLAAHALILTKVTKTDEDAAGAPVTTITDPAVLEWVFWALVALSIALYVVAHRANWGRLDFVRLLIPPGAFVVWTMLQKTTAFDAVAPGLGENARWAIAVLAAVVLGGLATVLAMQADKSSPSGG